MQTLTTQTVNFCDVAYAVPAVVDWPGTVIALNVGGALVPGLVSLRLLIKYRLWVRGLVATACVAAVCHMLAHPIPGLGIALPTIVPALLSRARGSVGLCLRQPRSTHRGRSAQSRRVAGVASACCVNRQGRDV